MKQGWMKRLLLMLVLATAVPTLTAEELKIGLVNLDRILRDSAPAMASDQKLKAEFSKRQKELDEVVTKLKAQNERFEKDSPVLSEVDRTKRQREITDLERELQRRQREFREDLNQRRSEEYAALIEKANRVVRQLAETEKIDVIFQEAVYVSPRVDITDKVIRALNNAK